MSDPLGLINDTTSDPLGLLNPVPKNQLVTSLSSDKPTAIRMPRPDDDATFKTVPDDAYALGGFHPMNDDLFGLIKTVFPESPFSEKASAQNAVQVARELGIAPSMVTKDVMNKYAQKKGAYTQPENKDFVTKMLIAPVAAGLMTHPLATVLGLTVFGGLAEAENFAVSKAKDEPYKFGGGKGLADLTKEGTSETVKDVLWLADMTWQAIAAGGVVKGANIGVDKFAEKFMRDTVTKYNMPRSVFISPEKIREFHGLGREDVITPEETALLKDINLTRSDYVNAVKNGIDIEIPSEKLVTIQDKPWVKAVKDFFKVSPYEETTIVPAGEPKAKAPVSGLIEGQSERRGFKDILDDIASLFPEKQRGSAPVIEGENLPPEKVAAMERLKKDFEVLKKEAEGAGKEVFKYMVENGIDEKSATYMMKIGGDDDTIPDVTKDKGTASIPAKTTPQAEAGNPFRDSVVKKPVYHGTILPVGKKEILEWKAEKGVDARNPLGTPDPGIHFGSINAATTRIHDVANDVSNWEDAWDFGKFKPQNKRIQGERPHTYYVENTSLNQAWLDIKNPIRLKDDFSKSSGYGWSWRGILARLIEDKKIKKQDITTDESARQIVEGYFQKNKIDGIVYSNSYEGGGDSYIVFNPKQIKVIKSVNQDNYNYDITKQTFDEKTKTYSYDIEKEFSLPNPTRPPDVGGQSDLKSHTEELPDDINELLSMAARQDKAAGDLTENPSYDAIRQKASQLAFEKIQKKIDFQKRKEAAALRRQGDDTARLSPVYQAMDNIVNSGGISKKSLEADYDKATVTEIMRKRPGLVSPNGKYGADVYADQHGFESGDDLINAILDWQGVKKEGAKAADDFTKNYGDLISKEESNDFHIALLEEEERILTQLLKGNAPKPAKGLKDFIRRETGQIPVETLMVSEYEALSAAMKKAEQASRKAFSAGNIAGALKEKTRQKELALEKKARLEAKQEAKDIHDGILKIMNDKNIPDDYKDKIGDFLSDYDLYPRSSKGVAQVESTREFLERMEIQGEDVNIPKSLLDKVERYGRLHWREMSLDQLRDIYDQVKMFSHLGKLKSKLIAAKEARDYDTVVSGIVDNIKKNWPGINAEPTPAEVENMLLDKSTWQAAKDKISAYQAELTKPEYIFRRLDRWQDLGPAWESFYKPIQDAYNQEVTDLAPIIKALQTMFEPFTKSHAGKWAREKQKIPGVPQILTKEKMIMVALNTGNDGNLAALKEGYNWTDEQVKAITDKLDAKEWRLVQDVWSLYKTMFPKLADVYNKLTGADLVPVEGNYHPLVFDRSLSWIADKNAAEAEMKDFFKTIYAKPNVTTGAVIERKGGKLPPKLSFNVIFNHVADVNHYISHALPVRDVQRLLSDPRVRSAIETAPDGIGGAESYSQLMPWLQNVAKPKVDPMSITESILKTIRRNTTTVALGLKFSVAGMQWLGMTQSIEAVGHNQFVKGFLDFYTHRGDMVDAIKEKSPEMANRAQSWDRELNDAYGRLGIENFKGSQAIKDAYFSLISLMDMAVAYPTWQAAYDQGMKQFNGDESKAIYYADMKVRNSQGNALSKDLAGIQRGSELKKFVTMFYTFFSSMQNQLAEVQTRFKVGEKGPLALLKSWWWIVVAPAILNYMMQERSVPGPKEVVRETIQYRLGGYPVIRDIFNPVLSGFDYQFSPTARFGEVAGKAINETLNLATEDADFGKWAQYSLESAGYIKGLPTGQALITIKGFNDLKNGETNDLTRLLFRGPREDDEE